MVSKIVGTKFCLSPCLHVKCHKWTIWVPIFLILDKLIKIAKNELSNHAMAVATVCVSCYLVQVFVKAVREIGEPEGSSLR